MSAFGLPLTSSIAGTDATVRATARQQARSTERAKAAPRKEGDQVELALQDVEAVTPSKASPEQRQGEQRPGTSLRRRAREEQTKPGSRVGSKTGRKKPDQPQLDLQA